MRVSARLLLATLVVLAAAGPAAAFVLGSMPPGNRMSMTLNLGTVPFVGLDDVPVTFNQQAERALAAWNGVGVGPLQDHEFFSSIAVVTPTRCQPDGINVVGFSATNCGLTWGDAVAVTHLWVSGGKILQADVVFNLTQRWDSYPGPLRTTPQGVVVYDLFRVALHEFGHVVGLDHVLDGTPSIMLTKVTDIDRLQPDDVAGARAVRYSPFGTAPLIKVTPAGQDFGQTRVGGIAERVLTVQNLGGATLVGTVAAPAPFACVSGCQYSLGIGETAPVTIRFAPAALGSFQGAVAFEGGDRASVPVSGAGVADARAAFVTGLFVNVLGRAPAAGELALWTGYLGEHPNLAGASGILHAFFDGPEFRSRAITPWTHGYLLVLSVLGRAPTGDELGARATELIGRLNFLLPLFVDSQEFHNLVPTLEEPAAASAAVTRLYQRALGRPPSAAELSAWTSYLVAARDGLGFARSLLGSVEYLAVPRTLAQHVAVMFRGLLGREPLPAEVTFFADWIGREIVPLETELIVSPESQARFQTLFQ